VAQRHKGEDEVRAHFGKRALAWKANANARPA
jgi:hypothetical protein